MYWDYAYDNPAVNGMGRLVGTSGPGGSSSYTYDVRGNVLNESVTVAESGISYTTAYQYNLANLESSLIYPGSGVQVALLSSYNPDGTLKSATQGEFCIQGTYTPSRKAETITASLDCDSREDISYSYDYDDCDRLYHFVSQSLYPQSLLVLERSYQFFDNDKIKAFDDNGQHYDLSYDGVGRLKTITGGLNITYTYDSADRITAINRSGTNTPRYFNDSRFPWAATQVGLSLGATYLSYDSAGFLTTRTKTLQPTYTENYDARGLLSSSSVSNSTVVHQWIYDHGSSLLNYKKTNTSLSGTDFVGKIYEDDYLQSKERWYYFFNGKRIALRDQAGAFQFFHPDQIQSIRYITNSTGSVISRHKYEPFGPEVDTLDGDLTKRAFNDRRKEGYKNLSRFPTRMYDAWAHQWTAIDSDALRGSVSLLLESGINPYAYCANDPINRIDNLGGQSQLMDIQPSALRLRVDKTAQEAFSLAKELLPVLSSPELRTARELNAAISAGDKEAVKQIITGIVVGAVVAGVVKSVVKNDSDNKDEKGDNKGKVYRVEGDKTQSGKPYIGRTQQKSPEKRGKADGRDRRDAEIVDRYNPNDSKAMRRAEQNAINREGGLEKLDNKRNEVSPEKWEEYGVDPPKE